MSWETAAQIVGCPVPTIDWHTRDGRIEHRTQHGHRPTLRLTSVVEFADWWQARELKRQARNAGPKPGTAPGPGWLRAEESADRLNISTSTLGRLRAAGTLDPERLGGLLWFNEEAVRDLAAARGRWISHAHAGQLIGVPASTVTKAVARGELHPRHVQRALPSLDRDEVLEWAEKRSRDRERADRVRADRQGAVHAERPPEDGREWLDVEMTALLLNLSPTWVRVLARQDRLPHARRGRRMWFVREHMALVQNARAAVEGASGGH